jgi:rubrerythrin
MKCKAGHQQFGKRCVKSTDAQRLREGMIAELGAINQYEQIAACIEDPTMRAAVQSIIDEEKTHFGEFQQMLVFEDTGLRTHNEMGRQEVNKIFSKRSKR